MTSKSSRVITFYSYKGGVGRSMALANVAWLLAEQYKKKVLIVDWDLESPGINRYFNFSSSKIEKGLIEIFYDYKLLLSSPQDPNVKNILNIQSYIHPIITLPNGGSISLLPAGRQDSNYGEKVNIFDWPDFYDRWHGFGFIEYLKKEFKKQADYILIDSRTGITDSGGICTRQLPDLVTIFFSFNKQSIYGTERIANCILSSESTIQPKLLIVPSRIEIGLEQKELIKWNSIALEKLSELSTHYINPRFKIPYIGYYSFGEELAVRHDPEGYLGEALSQLTSHLFKTLDEEKSPTSKKVVKKKPLANRKFSNQLEWWTELAQLVLEKDPDEVVKAMSKFSGFTGGSGYDDLVDLELAVLEQTNNILEKVWLPLPIDPDLTLWETYISPSAHYWPDEGDPRKEKITDLLFTLRETVNKSTSPIILHGQPGHGKTSTMRMLAQVKKLDLKDPTDTILFYEFKNLGDLNATMIQTLQRVTPFLKKESFFEGRKTVMILDGMDERQITDGDDQNLGNFTRDIFLLSARVNENNDSRLNVIFTGRTLFVEQVKRYFTGPYHQFEIADFSNEQIDRWLRKFSSTKNLNSPITRRLLQEKNLNELTKQPILLAIASRVLTDPIGIQMLKNVPRDQISRGRIYQIIISWTIRKEYQFERPISYLPNEEVYVRFLQIVAYIMFRRGEDSIPLKTLARKLFDRNEYYLIDEIFTNNSNIPQVIRELSVGFFFEGRDERSFSFIHKSMKDYLTVEAIFNLLTEALENFDLTKPERSCLAVAKDIYFILGKSLMTYEDHLPFILDILAQKGNEQFQNKLIAFFKAATNHQFLILHEGAQNENPMVTEMNLLGALSYWIFGLDSKSILTLPIISLMKTMPSCYPRFAYFLRNANLGNSNLQRTYLQSAMLKGANFVRANLAGANLRGADLRQANLCEADLRGADLREADLRSVDLRRANLSRADLERSNLAMAYLPDADLRNASLVDANLTDACLSGVNLESANLEEANLNGANLNRAFLLGIKNWNGKFWNGANVYKVKNAPKGFNDWVLENGATTEKAG